MSIQATTKPGGAKVKARCLSMEIQNIQLSMGRVRKIIWEAPGDWANLSTATRAAPSPAIQPGNITFIAGTFLMLSISIVIFVLSFSQSAADWHKQYSNSLAKA